MPYCYHRIIHFHETDAAGVVYFANLLTLCHEAYEAALSAEGFVLSEFFSTAGDLAVPIVHTEADFYRPLRCGDRIQIQLHPTQITPHSFEITYTLHPDSPSKSPATSQATGTKPLATALTRHTCINTKTRRRQALTPELIHWIAKLAEPSAPSD